MLYMLPPGLLSRVAFQESGYDPLVVSSANAIGLMQFTTQTAQGFSIDPRVPSQAIDAAGKYLRQLFDEFGSWRLALAAYNWGPTNLATYGVQHLPPETVNFVDSIAMDLGL